MSSNPRPRGGNITPGKGPPRSRPPSQGTGALDFSQIRNATGELGQLTSQLTGTVIGLLGGLFSPLLRLKISAREGDEEAERLYQEATGILRRLLRSGRADAGILLRRLGERID